MHTQVARLNTPTGTSAHDNEWNEMLYVFCQLATRRAETQLGKLALGGFHKPKQTDISDQNAFSKENISDCSIDFQLNKYVNLACFLNICKHIMVCLCFSTVRILHTAPLSRIEMHVFLSNTRFLEIWNRFSIPEPCTKVRWVTWSWIAKRGISKSRWNLLNNWPQDLSQAYLWMTVVWASLDPLIPQRTGGGGRGMRTGPPRSLKPTLKWLALPSSGVSPSAGATDRACVWSEGRQPFACVERYLADVAAAYLITWRGSELSLIIRPNYQAGVDRRPTKRQTAFIHSLRVRLLELSYLFHQESWETSLHPPVRSRRSRFIPAFDCTFNYRSSVFFRAIRPIIMAFPRLHLFDQKYSIVNYCYKWKQMFSIYF